MRELSSPGTWTGSGVLGGHRCRRPPSGGLLLVRGVVCPVVHRLEPGGGVAAIRALLEDGEVAHKGVGGRAVPVLLVRGADEGVAGADSDGLAVTRADQADALGDVQGLTDRVSVPV